MAQVFALGWVAAASKAVVIKWLMRARWAVREKLAQSNDGVAVRVVVLSCVGAGAVRYFPASIGSSSGT